MNDRGAMIWALGRACATAVLIVALAEGAARLALHRFHFPNGYETYRNPNSDRFWQRYTHPRQRGPRERLVILIANSQGFFEEFDDASHSYAARLEQMLNDADAAHTHRVLNWSVAGGHAPEMTVLAARAAAHRPDLVLFVTYSRNFLEKHILENPLAYSKTDVEQLAYLPSVRRNLSPWFLKKFRAYNARAWLTNYSALLQLHQVMMVRRAPGVYRAWTPGRLDDHWQSEAARARRRSRTLNAEPWNEIGTQLLEEFYGTFRRGLPATPLILVAMPLNARNFTPESWDNVRALSRYAAERLEHDARIRVVDATDAIPQEYFLSGTHMDQEGHRRFAEWLVPQILPILTVGSP